MEDRVYWLWLSMAVTPGTNTFAKLLTKFNSAMEIYSADAAEIASVITSKSRDYKALCDKRLDAAVKVNDFCLTKNVGILLHCDRNFPSMLKQIPTPPVLLYYRGVLPDFDDNFLVSVVGTRRLTDYGRRNAFVISSDLARAGAVIVSGMAVGIDGVAHCGAIAAGRPTVAVIGSGIDVLYPKSHGQLAKQIVKDGCVLTEYAPGTKPEKQNFPVRNRIISGLSQAVIVIEGKERSGAMITARHAREQERALYALPGNVGSPNSQLTNLLIKNGASLCTAADDVVRDFELRSHGRLNPHELAKPFSADMHAMLTKLGVSCVAVDDGIFKNSKKQKKIKVVEEDVPKCKADSTATEKTADLAGFDKTAIKLYKRIPTGEGCPIEALVDDELNLRDVMKGLLKLEMGCFITMLPGERVRRNF